MTLTTRQPSGRPPWPILLLAGAEKVGKSWECAVASSSDLIGRTLWVGIGEDAPDEYGVIPGVRFEIVEHDGTYRGILSVLIACAAEPPTNGKPNLIVLDSMTRLWDLLCDEQQHEANRRARAKAIRANKPVDDGDAQITMDLWNVAKSRWQNILDVLRDHDGPSIVTARLEEVTVLDERGNPTKERTLKVKAEKGLPYDAGVIVQLPTRGEAWLTGVRSARFQQKQDRTKFPGFTVDALWRKLGLAEKDATAPRQHAANDPEDKPAQEASAALSELNALCQEHGWDKTSVAALWEETSDVKLRDCRNAAAIRAFAKELPAHFTPAEATP